MVANKVASIVFPCLLVKWVPSLWLVLAIMSTSVAQAAPHNPRSIGDEASSCQAQNVGNLLMQIQRGNISKSLPSEFDGRLAVVPAQQTTGESLMQRLHLSEKGWASEWRRWSKSSADSDGNLFCFAFVKPQSKSREETVVLLAGQLAKACDGWVLFSSEDDPLLNVHRAYSPEGMVSAIHGQMRQMLTQGALPWLAHRKVLQKYRWLVKVDPDSFVRPSTLRHAISRYPSDFKKVVSTSNSLFSGPAHELREAFAHVTPDEKLGGTRVDGYFMAVPTKLATQILEIANQGSRVCDELISGHNEDDAITVSEEHCQQWSKLGSALLQATAGASRESGCKIGMPLPEKARHWLASVVGSNNISGWSKKQVRDWRLLNGGRLVNRNIARERQLIKHGSTHPLGDADIAKIRVGGVITVGQERRADTNDEYKCVRAIHADGVEFFVDVAGDALVVQDPNMYDGPLCQRAASALLRFYANGDNGTDPGRIGKKMCENTCPWGGHSRAVCVSPDFAVVHAVKDVATYERLVAAFP